MKTKRRVAVLAGIAAIIKIESYRLNRVSVLSHLPCEQLEQK